MPRQAYTGAVGGNGAVTGNSVTLRVHEDLRVQVLVNGGNVTLTITPRGNTATYTRVLNGIGIAVIRGSAVTKVAFSLTNSNLLWERGEAGDFDTADNTGAVVAFQGGTWTVVPAPSLTLVDNQAFDGTIANGTADAVSQAGATAIPIGTLVRGSLSGDRGLTTAADTGTYIALVGHTSGTVYAKTFAGENMPVAFRMPANEIIDIHTANADTVSHKFSAAWSAYSGE